MRKLLPLPLAMALAVALPLSAQAAKCTFTPTGTSCGPRLTGSEKLADGIVIELDGELPHDRRHEDHATA